MVDYLCRLNSMPICSDYNDLRNFKLQKPIYPTGVLALAAVSQSDSPLKKYENESIPEFKRYNIFESQIRDVV